MIRRRGPSRGELIAGGLDRFYLLEQTFIAVPFEHSEDIADQDYALLLAAQMAVDAPDDWKDDRRDNLDYFSKHRDIIRKFGRFPHRNAMLGRDVDAGGGRVPQEWAGLLGSRQIARSETRGHPPPQPAPSAQRSSRVSTRP